MNLNLTDLQVLTATNSKLGVQLSGLDKLPKSLRNKPNYDLLYNLVIDTAKGNKHQFTIDKSFLSGQTENEGWAAISVPGQNIVLFAKVDKPNNPNLITKFYQGEKATPVMTGKNIAELLLEKGLLKADTLSQMFKLEKIDSPKGTVNCTFYNLVPVTENVAPVQNLMKVDTEEIPEDNTNFNEVNSPEIVEQGIIQPVEEGTEEPVVSEEKWF